MTNTILLNVTVGNSKYSVNTKGSGWREWFSKNILEVSKAFLHNRSIKLTRNKSLSEVGTFEKKRRRREIGEINFNNIFYSAKKNPQY